ncbi:hypothetical protein ACFSQD_10955 [Flavihumibacter stibioxidans]|uniref:FemAB family protein n=1 Tax=Flavihumibacter stibioxidans TaxID=1834163 RepID=A0ABR7MBB7_9BACT|nr:hypothetical protein [Flavihumibacter stibioxidans]MBC6491858.1 hypothetical protein [Flavihumibacter stibioxidans]
MIRIKRKFVFLNVFEYWFNYKGGFWGSFGLNAYNHIRKELKNPFLIKVPNYTVELDLTKSKEQILEDFSRTVKSQVRNSEKDGVHCYFDQDVRKFVGFFNEFAPSKGIPPETVERILGYGDSLKISYAELDGQILAAHTYVYDQEQKIVRQMHSASKRFDEQFDKNKIGRANKYLHYRDMLAFKDQGITAYDFGGYQETHSDKVIESLLNFKLDFGAVKKTSSNYYTISYFLLRKLSLMLGIIKKG